MEAINIQQEFSLLSRFWKPQHIAMVNDKQVVLIKMKGETDAWFNHYKDDKYIQVIKGALQICFRNKTEFVNEGEIIIIPKATEYTPKAKKEVHILVFETFEPIH